MASESRAKVVGKCKRKQWSNDRMLAVMEAVKSKKNSVTIASS